MKRFVSVLVVVVACKDGGGTPDASAAASASASASAAPEALVTRGKWWDIAKSSRVYTEERRVDADNALRLLQEPARTIAVRALNDMAKQNADGDGLRAASQLARDAQDKVEDARNPAPRNAITTGGFMVLGGLIARACIDHPDAASLTPIMAAIREMPLPRVDKGDGRMERGVLEQELRTALDDKTMKALLASAPSPKKSL